MPNSWLEISRDNVRHNLVRLRALVAPARVMPVVKANHYGAGAVPIARELAAQGVDAFAVATVAEAVELREHGITGTLTVLTYFAADEAEAIVRHELSPVLFSDESVATLVRAAERMRRPARAWVKVDTGLGRVGVPWTHAADFARRVAKQPQLRVEGLLSTMTENPERNPVQVERLSDVGASLADLGRLPLSLASSQGLLSLRESYLDVVRPGLVLLGVVAHPEKLDPELVQRLDPRPVVTWKARVAYVKTVPCGEQVGYGVRAPLGQDAHIATLAIGWADGYPQPAQGSAHALVGGRRCPVLAISANSTMLDVSMAGDVAVEDEAVLIGRQGAEEIRATELLPAGGTLYRLLAAVPRSVPRLVVG
jgi:alanine racemase